MENTEMINTVEEIVSENANTVNDTTLGEKLAFIGKGAIAIGATIIVWEKLVKPTAKNIGRRIAERKIKSKLAKAAPAQNAEEDVDPSDITESDLAID